MTEDPVGWSAARPRVAYIVIRGEVPSVVIAEDETVLARVFALQVVATTAPSRLGRHVDDIRSALLEERWADAVLAWMEATGQVVDAYPDERVWRDGDLDEERAAMELRVAPVFRDETGQAD